MDDLIIDYGEGGIEYNHPFPDLAQELLELEQANNYNDGPFAALAAAVDSLPRHGHDIYGIPHWGGSDQGGDFAGIGQDEQSISSDESSGLQSSHRYESSVPESLGAPFQSDSESEDLGQNRIHIREDDSEEEEILARGRPTLRGRQHASEEASEDSLSSFELDQVRDYSENEQVEDSSQDGEGYQSSDADEAHPLSLRWDISAEIAAHQDDDLLSDLGVAQEIGDSSEDNGLDELSDDEILASRYIRGLDSSSEGQRTDSEDDEDDDDDESSLRSRHLHRLYSDDDDEASASGSSTDSSDSPSSESPSEGSIAPPSPRRAFVPRHPRALDALHDLDVLEEEFQILDNIEHEHQRLRENLRQSRGAHFGVPHPVRRANAPNGIDYFLDRLPVPQRDAQGLLAQMEMDLERGRHQRRRAAPSPIRAPPRPRQQREPAFIDLTGDSDSPPPEILALPDAPRFAGRDGNPFAPPRDAFRNNPRRNNPVRRAPSFARSDGSFLGPGGAPVIDLTNDAPEAADRPPRLIPPQRRREIPSNDRRAGRVRSNAWSGPNMNTIFRQFGIPRIGADLLQQMRVAFGGGQAEYEIEILGENILDADDLPDHFPVMENPLADNPVDFNYGANGINHEPARPQPAHIAPPEPREGFTRKTGEDTVVICPGCEKELKYDPDGVSPPPAKRAKTTKKDREEHHFWAVKACGHVSQLPMFRLPMDVC